MTGENARAMLTWDRKLRDGGGDLPAGAMEHIASVRCVWESLFHDISDAGATFAVVGPGWNDFAIDPAPPAEDIDVAGPLPQRPRVHALGPRAPRGSRSPRGVSESGASASFPAPGSAVVPRQATPHAHAPRVAWGSPSPHGGASSLFPAPGSGAAALPPAPLRRPRAHVSLAALDFPPLRPTVPDSEQSVRPAAPWRRRAPRAPRQQRPKQG
jgi:hypothetical protein